MQPLFLRAIKAQLVLLVTSMMFFTTGCEDDDHNHDEDHTDAEGFILENESGTEVYKEFKGAIITNNLTLSVGDTLELSVHFLDHDGEEIEHEEEEDHGEDEDELRITENDESIAIVEAEKHEEELRGHRDKLLGGLRRFESQLIEILPDVNDGLHIMKFINAAVESSNNNSKWINIS